MMCVMVARFPIGARLRKRRQQLRLTQRELARRLGVDPSTVSSWEKDEHFPERHQGALEAELGISLDEEPEFRPVSPEFRRMVAERLPDPEDQRRVIGLMEGTVTWPAEDAGRAGQPEGESTPRAM